MKKRIIVLTLALLLIITGVFGCGKKPMDPVAATDSFIDMFIYGETNETFTMAFANSTSYEDLASKQIDIFKSGLDLSLFARNVSASNTQSQELFQAFQKAVKDKSSYEVSLVSGNEKEAIVNITVTGLDYLGLISSYFDEVMTQAAANPSIASDTTTATDLALNIMIESLGKVKPVSESQEITLTLKADNDDPSKWTLDLADANALNELYSSFYIGEKDNIVAAEKMQEIISEKLKTLFAI